MKLFILEMYHFHYYYYYILLLKKVVLIGHLLLCQRTGYGVRSDDTGGIMTFYYPDILL